jgi:quinol-cytochrome oxidoreductase complex cytochrome b subunit
VISKALRWVVDRFGLGPIWDNVLDRQVPKDPWYHGDGMALMALLTVLVVTGVFLALGYCPAMDEAYLSVEHITHQQTLGWFVRGLHYWSGGLMVIMLFLHFCRQVLNGGYKAPREATWLVGVVLLFLVLATSLLGYILRWDERGLYGLRVALAAIRSVPYVGENLVALAQGGSEITSLTLTRMFAMHVVAMPLLLLLLVAYHVYLVILHGTTTMGERKEPIETVEEQRELYEAQAEHPVKGEVFFPTAVIKISPWSIVALTLAIGLTLIVGPRELMQPANLATEPSASEEWWFAWYSALVALLPPTMAPTFQWLFPVALFLVLVLLPFLDRSPHRGWRNRPVATTVVVLLVLAILGLSWLRYQSPWTGRPSAEAPAVPRGVVLAADAEQGRQLFPKYGCTSCHAVSGSGQAKVGTDLARMNHLYSQAELRHYILQPPVGVAMPSYAGRLPEEDLDRVVAFVLVAQTFRRNQE